MSIVMVSEHVKTNIDRCFNAGSLALSANFTRGDVTGLM